MNGLINLTSKEAMLSGVKFSLKELCDVYGKEHNKVLSRDIPRELSKLPINRQDFYARQMDDLKFTLKNGQEYNTKEISLQFAVWLFTKYDANMRDQIVDYAFSKMEQEFNSCIIEQDKTINTKSKEITKLEHKIMDMKSDKLIDWGVKDYSTVSKYLNDNHIQVEPRLVNYELAKAGVLSKTETTRTIYGIGDKDKVMYDPAKRKSLIILDEEIQSAIDRVQEL